MITYDQSENSYGIYQYLPIQLKSGAENTKQNRIIKERMSTGGMSNLNSSS